MKHLFLALLPVMLLSMVAEAQEVVPVTVQGQVTVHNKDNGKDIRERVEYTLLTKQQAQEAKAAFDRLTGEGDKSQNITEDEIETIDRLKRKYGFVKKNTTRASGRFTINAATTLCLLFITGQEAKVSDIIEIEPGKTEYDVVINVQRLREVVKQGKAVERESIGGGGGDTGDGNSYFHISLNIPKGIGKESSRLIIQTYAVCCQTDDTVAYCEPLVYEGKEYHELQNKCQLNIFHLPDPAAFDGAIMLTNTYNFPDEQERVCARFQRAGVPMLSLEVEVPDMSCIKTENYNGVRDLALHLVEHHNAKKIIYVNGVDSNVENLTRRQALVDVLKDHGLELYDEFHCDFGFYTSYMEVCANDNMALGINYALTEVGYNVPSDVLLTGFDMSKDGQHTFPIISLKLSILLTFLPSVSGPGIRSASWKSSSLPTRISDTEAISRKALESSSSRPFQKVAR